MRPFAATCMTMFLLSAPVLAADTPLTFDDPVQERRYHALLEELRCLVCQNQSLEDSHADLAQDLRTEVHAMIVAGRGDDEILAFMVERYGDFVLYRPPVRRGTWLLWFGPFLLLGIAVAVAVCHSRSRAARAPPSLTVAEQERVRRLLDDTRPGPNRHP
jgi:cytochrome c-type biogenesis protein CcmH